MHAILPVRQPAVAKTRLGLALDAEEREVLALGLLAHTLAVLAEWPPTAAHGTVHLVSDDRRLVEGLARVRPGIRSLLEPRSGGLNTALVAARRQAMAAGARVVLMLPADMPLLTVAALDNMVEAADAALAAGGGRPVVVLAPADARGGTNALLMTPPDIIDPSFGEASLEAHLRAAATAEASLQLVIDPALGFDLDTPDDLELLDTERLLEVHAMGERLMAELVPAAALP